MLKFIFKLNIVGHGLTPILDCCKIQCTGTTFMMSSLVKDLNDVTKDSLKRVQHDETEGISEAKKACIQSDKIQNEIERVKRKKIAMLVVYSGQGYLGLQRNPGRKTIEEELLVALFKSKYITEEAFNQPQIIQFQRAARTDKGVSAVRQILSMKLPEEAIVDNINVHLPPQIRAIAIKRVTKGFNCKTACDGRTYSYTLPTFSFAPHGETISDDYRVTPDIIVKVNEAFSLYEGTHNFHNFTCRRLPLDPSSIRYILNINCEQPFIIEGMEFAVIKIKGQSFMMHQIRKMVGLVISIVRGLATTDTITRAWEVDRLDLPIAPGLGLLLEEVHYDRYNKRYGNDGIHEPIEWSSYEKVIEDFKKEYILPTLVETEKNEKSMESWLETLDMHSYCIRKDCISDEKETNDELDIQRDNVEGQEVIKN